MNAYIRHTVTFAFFLSCLFITSHTQATILEFTPEKQVVSLGEQVSVDVNITLEDTVTLALGGYDIFMGFDNTLLSLDKVIFGDQLDLFRLGMNLRDVVASNGNLNVAELSFDSPDDLYALQPGSFTLFTLVFDTLESGMANLWFDNSTQLAEAAYYPIPYNSNQANIEIVSVGSPPPNTVHEPAGWLIALLGIALILYRDRQLNESE